MRSVETEIGRQYGVERQIIMLKADYFRTVSFTPGGRRREVGSRLTRSRVCDSCFGGLRSIALHVTTLF